MLETTEIRALRYHMEKNGFAFVNEANRSVCEKIAGKHSHFSSLLSGKKEDSAHEKKLFSAWMKSVGGGMIIISDKHPITSFVIIFQPGAFAFSKFSFLRNCGLGTIFHYGFGFFKKLFSVIDASAAMRKKYTGIHSWYIAKFIVSNVSTGTNMLRTLMGWLDASGEVIFSDSLSDAESETAAAQGFYKLDSQQIADTLTYRALFRKPAK